MRIDDLRNTASGSNALVMGNSAWRHDAIARSFDLVIVCNTAYRDMRADIVCSMDPETIYEILNDKAFTEGTRLVTPTEWEKPKYKALIEERFITHYAIEERFSVESMTGCMAISLAGWMGAENVVVCGFSLDGSHVTRKDERLAGGVKQNEMNAFRVGLEQYAKLCPEGRISVAVDPRWFLATPR